jgi:hypothetical protein
MFARFPGEEQGEAVKLLFHSVCCTAGGFHVGSKKGGSNWPPYLVSDGMQDFA